MTISLGRYHLVTIQGVDSCAPNKFQTAAQIVETKDDLRPCGNDFNGALVDDAAVLRSHMLALHMFCAPMITLLVMLSFLLDASPIATANLGGKAKRGAGAARRGSASSGKREGSANGAASATVSRRSRLIIGVAVWWFMVIVGLGVVYAAEHWRMFHFGGVIDDSIVIMHVLWMFHVPFVSTAARIAAGVVVVGAFVAKVSVFYDRYILRESCSQFDSLPLTSVSVVVGAFVAKVVIFRGKAPGNDMVFLVLYCMLAMVPMVRAVRAALSSARAPPRAQRRRAAASAPFSRRCFPPPRS